MPAISVLLEVTVDEHGDGEFGPFDPRTTPDDVAAFAEDHLVDLTRKEHESPWRITNVQRYEPPVQRSHSTIVADLD